MRRTTIRIEGEIYLTAETVAHCFDVEVRWVEDVHALGLVGRGAHVEDSLAIASVMLDRLAAVLRLQRQQGVNLEGVLSLLGEACEPWLLGGGDDAGRFPG